LGFKEFYFNSPNSRIFDVLINGKLVLKDYDIYKAVGPDVDIYKFSVKGKDINIEFLKGSKDFPKVSYIKISPKPAIVPPNDKYIYYDKVAGYRDSCIVVKVPIIVRDSVKIQ
jgi:hypothetical protein